MCNRCNGSGAIHTHYSYGVMIEPCGCQSIKYEDLPAEEKQRRRDLQILRAGQLVEAGALTWQQANEILREEVFQ